MIHIDTTIVNFVLGTLIPIITALVVKDVASPGIKATVNAVLAAITGALVVALQAGGILNWQSLAVSVAITVGTAVIAYFGLLKPTGVTGAISSSTANFGIGTPVANSKNWDLIMPSPVFVPADPATNRLGSVVVWKREEIPVGLPSGYVSTQPPVVAASANKVFDQENIDSTRIARPVRDISVTDDLI